MNTLPTRRPPGAGSKLGAIAAITLVAVYSIAAPQLNRRFGWNLPALRAQADDLPGADKQTIGPLSDQVRSSAVGDKNTTIRQPAETLPTTESDDDLLYGLLREVSPRRYVSPAGLLYTPGSAEGHRLQHLRRHTQDDPQRAGSHGVFDGEMKGALETIDRAYQRAKQGQRTTRQEDQGRTIYTVDMGGRVGFVGGRDGNRKRKPMARRVRLVLEGNRFITAYPL